MKLFTPPTAALMCAFSLLSQPTLAGTYLKDGDLIGSPTSYTITKGDNLSRIARRFDVGLVELKAANSGLLAKLTEGQVLVIPTQHLLPNVAREGIVVNLGELRLYDYGSTDGVVSVPITVGTEGWDTPLGETTITAKRKNPTWTPPASIREQSPKLKAVYPSGPKNPLGLFAMNLGWPGYLIHGTNSPTTIGEWASHGCIRLYPEDIKSLFLQTPTGTKVTVVSARFKLGWHGDELLIEVNPAPSLKSVDAVNLSAIDVTVTIVQFVGTRPVLINGEALALSLEQNSGVPTVIATAK